jgi:leucyl aminopeptidase
MMERFFMDYTRLLIADTGQTARLIEIVAKDEFDAWYKALSPRSRTAVDAARFMGGAGEQVRLFGDDPADWHLAIGAPLKAGIWGLAGAVAALPAGHYRLQQGDPGAMAIGWLLAHYRFDRYTPNADIMPERVLLTPNVAEISAHISAAKATALVRDLVNTPAADMGPSDLEDAAVHLANQYGGTLTLTKGDALAENYPMIHAVGKAAARSHAPSLIEVEWGNPKHPRIAIVGKGVCFDSGGLDIKPSSGMRLMKKDMGGAAHALGLAQMVMEARLPVRLHLLIPAVENAIAGNAFRPGDILTSRRGLTVEIDNTDAEGRLVLADALTKAQEDAATLILDFATLTGAARVALGPDLPALFSNDDAVAEALLLAGTAQDDPCWRLPLWGPYTDMLKSDIADMVNSAEGGMAGASTAALFLQKFVPHEIPWAHFDTFAWRPSGKPGQPKGGEALGMRAAFAFLKDRYPAL